MSKKVIKKVNSNPVNNKKVVKTTKKSKKPLIKTKKKRFSLFPAFCDKLLIITTFLLIIFSSFMIASAAQGESAGDTSVITNTFIRQILFFILGLFAMIVLTRSRAFDLFSRHDYDMLYWIVLIILLITRAFGETNGAYGWIRIFGLSLQPSEFAKLFIMMYGAKILGYRSPNPETNKKNLKQYIIKSFIYVGVIALWQHDFGSAVVLGGIVFCILLIPGYKEFNTFRKWMLIIIGIIIVVVVIIMLPITNDLLSNLSDHYQVARFLAAANPFAYQYDSGYHLIMGLVSFATGGWFGLGYTNSIHKYMNFPNPTTDFILPVIVEELGIVFGLMPILIAYGIIFYKLIRYSLKVELVSSKMILTGTFAYLFIHFVLNVGGVSGLIPLTGVPLLLVSSGGSSLVATMCAIGLSESEIIKYRRDEYVKNNSGQIQENQSINAR